MAQSGLLPAEVEPVLLFPTNLMVRTEISQQILEEQGCSMLGGSISQEIQYLKISQHQH